MEIPMTIVHCANCGIPFTITSDFEDRRRKDHGSFYCPAGHSQSYQGETELERARKARDLAVQLKLEAQKELEALKKKKCKKTKKR